MATRVVKKHVRPVGAGLDVDDLGLELGNWDGRGEDPLAKRYADRRLAWSLFTPNMTDSEILPLQDYLFPVLPQRPSDEPIKTKNLIAGRWGDADRSVQMPALFDRRVILASIPDSQGEDVEAAVSAAYRYWEGLEWAEEVLTYRKWVVQNVSRILNAFSEEILTQIRHLIPKTRVEAQRDFWEGKRAADHIAGNADKAMRGELVPPQLSGQTYWKNPFLPAGVAAIITPMNFIYGIPLIQLCGAYIAGVPLIFKGHPFAAIANTSLAKIFLAAGADPRAFQKLEGFGKGVGCLATDARVAVVSITGAAATAKTIAAGRGLRALRFEGGGCNWAWVDNEYSDDELRKIAVRLAYSKLAFSSHKCTTLHGIAADRSTLDRLIPYLKTDFTEWAAMDPRLTEETKVLGPIMVHKAQTVSNIQEASRRAGLRIHFSGGRLSDSEYFDHAEVTNPVLIEIHKDSTISVDFDGEKIDSLELATTELFMPILMLMELQDFDSFLKFSLLANKHDLACAIWSRDDGKIQRARRVIGGMLKENDGTDSALEWEEFGASGIGESGNMGVGDAESTIATFCRKQKGRHIVF